MGDASFVRVPGSLDPRAAEFRPRTPYTNNQINLIQPQIYYPYPTLPPYPLAPFCDGEGVLTYPQFTTPSVYVIPPGAHQSVSSPLPPPSSTPTRTLLLSSVLAGVSESAVRRELELFGDVRAVQMERVHEGLVTVHFYDLRAAKTAIAAIRDQHMQQQSRLRKHFDAFPLQNSLPPTPPPAPGLIAGHVVWAQYMTPVAAGLPDGHNHGTLVIFNLDSAASSTYLKRIFEAYGPVKELRETPMKRNQRFVEFFDVRDAAKALAEMNGREIIGKHIVIEYSRPGGGHRRRFSQSSPSRSTISTPTSSYIGENSHSRHLPPQFCRSSEDNSPPPRRRPGSGRRNPNLNSLVSLRIGNEIGGPDHINRNHDVKKNRKKDQNENTESRNSRSNRGKQSKRSDSRFLIKGDDPDCGDSRTTLMIKNIPNKYSQQLLLKLLDNHCILCNERIAAAGDDQPLSSYDFVYLPIDFTNKCNVGYGFVNMTSPEATLRMYQDFHRRSWEAFNSKKICEVTYARLQGLEALKEHFKNSKFACEVEEYLPVVFTPPRDGKQMTEPAPIACRATACLLPSPPAVSSNSYSETDDDEEEEVYGGGATARPTTATEAEEELIGNNDGDYVGSGDGSPNGGDDE